MKVSITTTTHSLAVYICMVCGKPVNESDTVDHIMSCEQPASFRGERFVPLEGERMNTTAKKSEKKEEEKPKNLMKNLNSFVKNAGSELAKLAKSMEEDENPEFVCMICGKKLSSEKMQSHTKHCKVPKGFKGSQFMVLESDEMRMKKAEEEEEKVIVKVEEKTEKPEKPEKPEEEKKEEEEPKEEKPVEEVKVTTPNPFDNASEEEESGNPFGAPEEEKKEEKPVEQEKPEEKPVEQEKPEEKPVEEVKVATPNPFDNASEEEENGNPFGAPEEEKKEEKPAEEEKVEEKPEEEKEETAANPFDKAEESEEKPASEEEESEEEKKEGKMRFGFNSLVKNASKSLAKLAKSMEEEDENPEFVCMICGKKLSSEKMQSHTKHCKVPKGFKGSQFMVLESDEMRMKKAEEEEKPVEQEKVEEKPVEPEPKSANPFDNASEEEEEESGNPFGAPEEEKKEEKPVEEVKVAAPNPFDNASEEEEESGNPFGAPEEEKPEPEPVKSANPFDNASEEEEESDPVPLEQVPTTPAFISSSKKQKSIFNIFRRDTNERKSVGPNLFSSITQSITSTVTNIVNSTQEPEEDPLEKAAREEEERMRREAAERMRREEEERIRKEREEAERKRREEEERIRKKAMMEQKLNAGIACKKYCGRGKPHPTTVSLITHASKGEMVGVWRGREG